MTKNKKIILTVTNDLSYDQRMIRICTSLANADYDVTLIGRKRSFSKPFVKRNFKQKRLTCWFNKGKFFYLEYNLRLFCYLLFRRFDLICSIDLDTILAGYFVTRIRGKICVYDAHEYFTEVPEVIQRPNVKKMWERIAYLTVPNLIYCYTVCESLVNVFEKKYGTAFSLIRNVPFAKENKSLTNSPIGKQKESPPVLLYQGALNDGRGLEQIIDAMPNILNANLWLAGEGDLSNELRQQVKHLKLENRVHFLGYLLPEDLKKITPKATLGLNLLENKGLNYYYSLANKAFDYIQADLPAIHMDFPEYQKINAQYEVAILINNLEKGNLAQTINNILANHTKYKTLLNNCKLAAKEYTWEKEEIKLVDFYNSIWKN